MSVSGQLPRSVTEPAEHVRTARGIGVPERVERGARLAVARVDVEHLDLLPVRHGLGTADHLVGAQVQAEAVPHVLPARLATVRLRLGDDRLPAELHLGVDVRTLGQLDVDVRRERRAPEVGREVRQDVVAGPVGGRGAERVVLQPVGVERRDDGTRDRGLVVARRDPAADRPDAEERQDVAPEPVRDRVLPDRDDAVLGLPPARLERGDGELARLRGRVVPRPRRLLDVQVEVQRPAVVLLVVDRQDVRPRVVDAGHGERCSRALALGDLVERLLVGRDRLLRGPVARRPVRAQLEAGERLPDVVTQRSPQGSADLVCHGLLPPDECRHLGVPARRPGAVWRRARYVPIVRWEPGPAPRCERRRGIGMRGRRSA